MYVSNEREKAKFRNCVTTTFDEDDCRKVEFYCKSLQCRITDSLENRHFPTPRKSMLFLAYRDTFL